ncbi:hypothetical protein DI392_18145 [Vibrio albus]|jgi:hypothetical protein|uniref:DUF3024 domain-containing protein n=1 Tax=Vibrio albus TaxID=2200953 RepID=A0A2U3B571_9VIBR|nr:DUF3024 domain-containing protein [Vibrio albus]PWI31948.1 hypothetical protein DI392_18145 [Vibrio albus]
MSISEIEQYRLEKAVRALCCSRNQNTPVEQGKLQYEIYTGGVIFSELDFLLDSSHCNSDNPIAKLEYDKRDEHWMLYVAQHDPEEPGVQTWLPYPNLSKQETFDPLLEILEEDPQHMFW